MRFSHCSGASAAVAGTSAPSANQDPRRQRIGRRPLSAADKREGGPALGAPCMGSRVQRKHRPCVPAGSAARQHMTAMLGRLAAHVLRLWWPAVALAPPSRAPPSNQPPSLQPHSSTPPLFLNPASRRAPGTCARPSPAPHRALTSIFSVSRKEIQVGMWCSSSCMPLAPGITPSCGRDKGRAAPPGVCARMSVARRAKFHLCVFGLVGAQPARGAAWQGAAQHKRRSERHRHHAAWLRAATVRCPGNGEARRDPPAGVARPCVAG